MRVSEIRVKQIRVNQGLGVVTSHNSAGKSSEVNKQFHVKSWKTYRNNNSV